MVGIAFPRFLDGRKISQGTDVIRRAELGKLIADPKNEAMAKAFVNRMWAHFLGRGFVNPVDDFGPHNPPSHPELLDQLAKDFQESGYDVKKLCRWITAQPGLPAEQHQGPRGARRTRRSSATMQLKPMTPRAALRLAADGDERRTRPGPAMTATSGATPGSGSSSSPSRMTRPRNRPASRGRSPRR